MNLTLRSGHLTKETGKLSSLQSNLKLTSLMVLGGGWYNHYYED